MTSEISWWLVECLRCGISGSGPGKRAAISSFRQEAGKLKEGKGEASHSNGKSDKFKYPSFGRVPKTVGAEILEKAQLLRMGCGIKRDSRGDWNRIRVPEAGTSGAEYRKLIKLLDRYSIPRFFEINQSGLWRVVRKLVRPLDTNEEGMTSVEELE
jgi:hypothetical protein